MPKLALESFALAVLTLGAVACSGSDDAGEAPATAPAPSHFSSSGLVIAEQGEERVAGSFSRHDKSVTFELTRTASGHVAKVLGADGEPLVVTTLEGGVEDAVLLGGVARVHGQVDALEPTIEGDAHVFERMSAIPEVALIPELKEALLAKGIDPTMFSAPRPGAARPGAPSATPQAWKDVWGYWHLNCREYVNLPTWSFWGWTTFELVAETTTSASIQVLTPWYNPPEYTGFFSGKITLYRQYAGYQAQVKNQVTCLSGQTNWLDVRAY